jgi:hypothetical protein
MTAYDPTEWSDLFVAAAGASAALAGLVFVAVSINVDRIIKLEGLPERALGTVLLLLGGVIVSTIGLAPGQSTDALGIELAGVGAVATVAAVRLLHGFAPPEDAPPAWQLTRYSLSAIGTLPFVIGGVSLIVESGGGLYWVLGGIVGAFVGGVLNAWVLLVEILR